jgi:hypothetical protein
MPRRPRAEALYVQLSRFLTSDAAYDVRSHVDARVLVHTLEREVYEAVQHGPDITPEREAYLQAWLRQIQVTRGPEPVAAEAVARG